jgi:hypothetical protein
MFCRVSSAEVAALMIVSAIGGVVGGLIGFIIWILIMVWIYNIAKRKGRHAVGWTILGFFFTVITLIVVLLLPSKRTTAGY